MPGDFEDLLAAFPNGFDFKKPEPSSRNDDRWNEEPFVRDGSSPSLFTSQNYPSISPAVSPNTMNGRSAADNAVEERVRALTEMLAAQNSRITSLEKENKSLKTGSAVSSSPTAVQNAYGPASASKTASSAALNRRAPDESIEDMLADLLGKKAVVSEGNSTSRLATPGIVSGVQQKTKEREEKPQVSQWKGFKGVQEPSPRPSSNGRASSSTAFNRTTYAGGARSSSNPPKPRAESSGSSGDEYNRYVNVPERRDERRPERSGGTNGSGSIRRGEPISIHGKANRDRQEKVERASRGTSTDSSEDEGRPEPRNGERVSDGPRGWRQYKNPMSDEEDGHQSEESVDIHRELKNEWQFEDIQDPYSKPKPRSISMEEAEIEPEEPRYGKIEYNDNFASGWKPNITRRENPNEPREVRSLRRFQESTAALNVEEIPDYIPARQEYAPPHVRNGRHLDPDERPPEPTHWAGDREDDSGNYNRDNPRRFRRLPPVSYYANPGGGYGQDRPSSSNSSSVADNERPWIQPRQEDRIEQPDEWRASWENQRRGVAGRFNKKNRGL